ncbi:MAG TPA: ATP-binding protein [Candidatus Angelobacter sp.]|nr:ATP-binding protein [Candidatus Angelobacter sp.]
MSAYQLSPEERELLRARMKQVRLERGIPEDGHAVGPAGVAERQSVRPLAEDLKAWMGTELERWKAKMDEPGPGDAVVYRCSRCKDDPAGWIDVVVDGRHRVERCECWHRRRAKRLLECAGLPEEFDGRTLENYECGNSALEMARLAARRFVDGWPGLKEKPGLVMWGHGGGGKTHLAVAIARLVIELKGARCLFRSYSALLQQLQGTFNTGQVEDEYGNVATAYELVRDICECDVLIVDDIGPEKLSEWNRSMLYHVVNERYNHRRATVVTTNLPWDSLAVAGNGAQRAMRVESLRDRVGERVHSRLAAMCRVVEVRGEKDWRRG